MLLFSLTSSRVSISMMHQVCIKNDTQGVLVENVVFTNGHGAENAFFGTTFLY